MNFFLSQRDKLGLNRTQIAARLGTTAEAVRTWETEQYEPSLPIAKLAAAYEVSEDRMGREVMAQRMRREKKLVASK